ncbi:glycosyltransferase family 4 protein [Nibricoccus sp. IMCC34717]|uniref:glycosyltransferase family 4 protein n=1 Tax=Nibricoccus sp. IMCC34717 TaxID=3034021 RepID=UPI00384E9B25
MPLVVLAQTPPPVHGQSLMVQALVEGWEAAAPGHPLLHVNLGLSGSTNDIGRWQWGKLHALRRATREARAALLAHPGSCLYYVPAPGKLISVVRDCLALPALRRTGAPLVLHWHAAGLGSWMQRRPFFAPWLQRALGGAALALLPSRCLEGEVAVFRPRRTAVVSNGIADPFPAGAPACSAPTDTPTRLLFLGACTEEKGVSVLAEAFARLDAAQPGRFHLALGGSFPDQALERQLRAQLAGRPVSFLGWLAGEAKQAALAGADVVCLPTHYPYEVQPLVALEALAADRVVVATRWRGLPEALTGTVHGLCEPRDARDLARVLAECAGLRAAGRNRAQFLERYSLARHLRALAEAVLQLPPGGTAHTP